MNQPTQHVTILGGHQTDFATNIAKQNEDVADLTKRAIEATLDDAGIDADAIESIHVGNAFGQLYNGQGHMGAMPATVIPELWGVPSMRHEAACASASMATLSAMAEIESGRYDCVLVLGVEQEKNMPGAQAASVQTAAAWVGHETEGIDFFWPYCFDRVADEYDKRFGVDDEHLRAIGELNLRNAKANPNAQTREWKFTSDSFGLDDHLNPVVHGRLRRNDVTQITDGAAGVVLVSDRWLTENGGRASIGRGKARIAGWGHRTVGLPISQKFERSADTEYVMPHVREAITDAMSRAGISGVEDLDLIETHDCMTPSEYLAIDHFGITAPGESWKAVEDGSLERDGRIPVNPSGGLIGGGHPVGATGARMLVDAMKQVSETAGDYQIDGARRAATLNIGGSTATTACFVVESI
ncbi:MAG: thiolase domain-containing protein [Acidimicrobiaceae bacterium]|nr:thiolase domain-containing protein [Acidimicrobiaceae bacterium]MDG1409283.1 acetyl-CoA acetyltransferase [Acidimicrobiales bacterium]